MSSQMAIFTACECTNPPMHTHAVFTYMISRCRNASICMFIITDGGVILLNVVVYSTHVYLCTYNVCTYTRIHVCYDVHVYIDLLMT